MTCRELIRIPCVIAPGAAGLILLFLYEPIPQDPAYHSFADKRTIFGIPRFLDVVTNVALVAVGASGLLFMARHASMSRGHPFRKRSEHLPYTVLFLGLLLTGVGSAYYHLAPDTARLFWDRLPMTLVFMALTAIVIAERIDLRTGRALLGPLLLAGAVSVAYWHGGELQGKGDLRLYALVQFVPLATLPIVLLLYPPRYTHARFFWYAFLWYGVAKVFEHFDRPIFETTGFVSGHSVKHLCAAMAIWVLLAMIKRRKPLPGYEK